MTMLAKRRNASEEMIMTAWVSPGIRLVALVVLLALAGRALASEADWPRMTPSADGVPIAYEVRGTGEPTLVLVHGWSCDARYWRAQLPHLTPHHRVVTLDLAGHGHSGLGREHYDMAAFGEDVKAVVDDLGAERVILAGHSMGGAVSVEAAHLMPERVIGIVGVDTFHDVGMTLTQAQLDDWLAPLQADFPAGASEFVAQMFIEQSDPALRDWVVADMSTAPPRVALGAFEALMTDQVNGDAAQRFAALAVPVVAINADLWPTDIEANRGHLPGFEAVILEESDHFLHMARPEAFNPELMRVITAMMAD